MPSIKFHVARSITKPPELARKIHEALDMPPGLPYFDINLHMKWRQLTHNNLLVAAFIGYIFDRETGPIDAVNHVKDDALYNRLFYSRRSHKDNEDESEEEILRE